MNIYTTDKIRNVVLLGHGGSGKTSLTEAMAYLAGITSRMGKVTDGNTAGAGAVAILLGKEPREAAKTICGKSDYIELSQSAFFMEKYIEEMMFEETIGG